jgi:putative DNA primase/helicase
MTAEITQLQDARAKLTEEPERRTAREPAAAEKTAKSKPEPKEGPEKPAPRPDELWHSRHEAWATLPNGCNHPVQSTEFRHWLVGECVRDGLGCKKARIDALVEVYTAIALYEGPEHQLHLRTAPAANGGVYIDLANEAGQAIYVSAEGWKIISAPVKFYRPPNMKPLPRPLRKEADTSLLQLLLNLPNDSEFRLLLTACSYALLPGKAYPIIVFDGHAGAAKTSAARIVRNTLDPNEVPVTGMPRGQDLVSCAKNNAVMVLDNLSVLPAAVQDDLCRLATGGGMGGRKLYTNDGDASFTASRPLILTGINNLATRSDLADRCLPFHLSEVLTRKTDAEIQEGFSYAHPRVFAGLLDIMVVGLRRIEEVQRGRRPLGRMADFTQWGYAVAPAIGWTEDDFRLAYRATRREAQHTVIDSDPVAAGILTLVHGVGQQGKPWRGFQSSLWKQLAEAAGDAAKAPGFPRSPEALGRALKRVIPVLGDRGIRITQARRSAGMWVTIEP